MPHFLPNRWEAGLGVLLALLPVPLWYLLPPEPRVVIEGIHRLNWLSPDGSTVCTVHRSGVKWIGPMRYWDTRTGEKISTFVTGNEDNSIWPAFSPDHRRFVVSTSPDRLLFGDWQTGLSWTAMSRACSVSPEYCLFSPDGEVVAVLEATGNIALFETATGRILDRLDSQEPGGGPTWQFTRNGAYLVYGFSNKKTSYVRLWNTRTRQREPIADIEGDFLAISPDSKTLVTVQYEPKSDANSTTVATLWELDPPSNDPRARLATKAQTLSWNFSDDSKALATWDGSLQTSVAEFWNVQTGQLIAATPEFEEIHGGAFSPDKSRFALSRVFSTGEKRNRTQYANLILHDVANGAEIWTRTWNDYHGFSPRFNSSGRLVQVYVEGRVEFLDAATGRTVALARFRKPPTGSASWTTDSLGVTPDLRLLSYREEMERVSFDPTKLDRFLEFLHIPKKPEERSWDMVSVLDMETGREIVHLEGIGTTNPALLSDDGLTLATQHADHIAVWDVPARPPLRWVLGVPAALVLAFVGMRYWRYRRKSAS